MKKYGFLLVVVILVSSGCSTMRWTEMDDGPLEEPSEKEIEYLKGTLEEARLFEDFNDTNYAAGVEVKGEVSTEKGTVSIPGTGYWVEVKLDKPVTRLIACYKLTSNRGHIFISTDIPEGHTDIFNDMLGVWGHNMEGTTPYTRINGTGYGDEAASRYMVQELRIEEGELVFLKNNRSFGTIDLEKSRGFSHFDIRSNDGGKGVLDWIAAK